METPNSEQKNLTLPNGVTVTLHYAKDGPSLTSLMIAVMRAHIEKAAHL